MLNRIRFLFFFVFLFSRLYHKFFYDGVNNPYRNKTDYDKYYFIRRKPLKRRITEDCKENYPP